MKSVRYLIFIFSEVKFHYLVIGPTSYFVSFPITRGLFPICFVLGLRLLFLKSQKIDPSLVNCVIHLGLLPYHPHPPSFPQTYLWTDQLIRTVSTKSNINTSFRIRSQSWTWNPLQMNRSIILFDSFIVVLCGVYMRIEISLSISYVRNKGNKKEEGKS